MLRLQANQSIHKKLDLATPNETLLHETQGIKAYLNVGQLNKHGLSDGLVRFLKQSFFEQQLTRCLLCTCYHPTLHVPLKVID